MTFFPSESGCEKSIFGLCSGHGRCLENICQCDSGWSGQGHLISLEGLDCYLNIPTATVFHAFLLVVQLHTFYIEICKGFEFMQAEKHGKRGRADWNIFQTFHSTWGHHPGFRGITGAFVSSIFAIMIAINQFRGIYIGNSVSSTILYILYLMFYWMTSTYYTSQFVKISTALISTSPNEKERIALAQQTRVSPAILLTCVTFFQAPPAFATGLTNNLEYEHIFTFIWAFTWCILYGIMAISLIKSNSVVAAIFEEDTDRKQTFAEQMQRSDVALGLRTFVKQIRINFVFVCCLYGMAAFWPWFRTRFTYVLPILMALSGISFGKGMKNLSAGGGMVSDDSIALFIRLVNDSEGYAYLQSFLAKEFSSENLNFWTTVEEYRDLVLTIVEKEEVKIDLSTTNLHLTEEECTNPLLFSARNIYLTFVAPEVVNLPDTIRSRLNHWFRDLNSKDEAKIKNASSIETLRHLFIEAQMDIFNLLRADPLHRFQRSKDFQKLKDKWEKEDLLISSRGSKSGRSNLLPHRGDFRESLDLIEFKSFNLVGSPTDTSPNDNGPEHSLVELTPSSPSPSSSNNANLGDTSLSSSIGQSTPSTVRVFRYQNQV